MKLYSAAEPFLRLTKIYRQFGLCIPHPYFARLYLARLNQLALTLMMQQQYKEALSLQTESLNIATAKCGKQSAEAAESLINMAAIHAGLQNPEEQSRCGEAALSLIDNLQHLDDRQAANLASALNNLGVAYADSGKSKQAMEMLRRCSSLQLNLHGAENPNYITSLGNIGYSLLKVREYNEAAKYFEQCLAKVNPADPVYPTHRNNYGEALRGMGKLDESEKNLKESLDVRERTLPAEHFHFAYSYHNLGKLYADKGDKKEAEKYFDMAIKLRQKQMDARNPILRETLEDKQAFIGKLG
jgi:tetratricopeptide (TPR) repeat protein